MKKIFISGAYSAPTRDQVEDNIAHARQAAIELTRQGWAVFCPHLNTAHFEERLPELTGGDWLARCVAWLECCDAIYVLAGSDHSVGTGIEVGLAKSLGLEIIHEQPGVSTP